MKKKKTKKDFIKSEILSVKITKEQMKKLEKLSENHELSIAKTVRFLIDQID